MYSSLLYLNDFIGGGGAVKLEWNDDAVTRSDSEAYAATPGSGSAHHRTRTLKKKRGAHDSNSGAGEGATAPHLGPSPSSSSSVVSTIMRDLVQNTAISNQELKRSLKNPQGPALNFVTTMPKNLTRFVMRITPLVKLQDEIIEIFMWKNQYRTMVVMLSYIIMCTWVIFEIFMHPI